MKINQLKAGVVLSYVSMFLGNAISIIYTPIMLNLLGQSEYGLYQLVSSVVSYLGILSFGFGSAYIRYYFRYKVNDDEKNIAKLNGMYLTIFSVIGIIALLAGAVMVCNVQYIFSESLTLEEIEKAKVLMALLVFNVALSFPMSIFSSHIRVNERYLFTRILSMIRTVANPFIMLPILFMGYKSIVMVAATVVINITVEIIYAFYSIKILKIKFSFKAFDKSLFREIAIFSSFIFINLVIDQVNWNVDKFLLGIFQGTTAVAIYAIASQLNGIYLGFSTSISTVFVPRINQLVSKSDDNNELTDLFTRVGRVQFLVLSLILSGIIFWGKAFIQLWAGDEYKQAYLMLLLLIIPVTIPLIQNIGIEIQRAKDMHKFRSWVYLGIAIANVFISIPLCKLYAGLGCAIGTAIALFVGNGIIMNIYYHKKVRLNMIYFWKQIFGLCRGLIIPIIIGIGISLCLDLYNIIVFLCSGISYVLIFGTSMWFFGMNKYEKDLVVTPVLKFLRKLKLVKL